MAATKLEAWAKIWAMHKLKYYLLGRHFISRVDHKPLVAMQEGKMNSIMENWMFLQVRYDFTTLYLPGEANNFADAFSRMFEGHNVYVGAHESDVQGKDELLRFIPADTDISLRLEAEKRGKKLPSTELKQQLMERNHALSHLGTENVSGRYGMLVFGGQA